MTANYFSKVETDEGPYMVLTKIPIAQDNNTHCR
jgi:hypothetical protein